MLERQPRSEPVPLVRGGRRVPASRYRQDARVFAVMVEVNRRLYLHEADATRRPDFDAVAAQVRACWGRAMEALGWG